MKWAFVNQKHHNAYVHRERSGALWDRPKSNCGGAGVENLDVDTIREILSRRPEGEKFDEIRIELPAEGKENFIPGEAVMEACKYLIRRPKRKIDA